ncbi:holo-ACP synthase [Leptospira kmetyi]|uniref:holo-ACP synthase n=1 Tax=Leptospira kmetyi TaxID=408139 RepID=UPI000287E66C|nr:holo-ACP synthase [Leptospira kmetyi]EQA55663.1 holo-[acyl-carrier-protein] synthase [Leptospira kmetyi serovar Malaysia str. Bejo-Iso9]TGL69393.1 holo-[acyl-carrier-protein] synthase [Leptospira kmetyi]
MNGSYSIGMDMVYIPEFESFLKDRGTFFFEKTFTEWEKSKANSKNADQRASFYSGRYAAKEAFLKALDGRRLHAEPDLNFNYAELEIRNDEYGRPFFRYYGILMDYVSDLNLISVRLTITHTQDYAASQVLVQY